MGFGAVTRLGFVVILLFAVALPAAAKVSDKTKYKHYTVRGSTPTAIVIDMYKKRRLSGRDFTIATIETKVTPGGELIDGKKSCRVKNFSLHSTHTITLPRHANERRLKRRTRKLFRAFVKNARNHELRHRAIYRGCMRRMHRAITRMPRQATCRGASRQIERIAKAEGVRCKAEHAAFDKREYSVSSKMPLLREAIRDVEAMKASRISRAAAARALAGDAGGFSASQTLINREKSWRD